MEPDELEVAKRSLRAFAAGNGLGWVLDELDEAVAIGVVEVKPLRQSIRQGRQVYEEVLSPGAVAPGRRRAEEFLTRRPMTDQEQVEALILALRRALVDPDAVARAAVDQVNGLPVTGPRGERSRSDADGNAFDQPSFARTTLVTEIDFAPDEGSLEETVSTEGIRYAEDRRITVEPILDALMAEVRR